MNIFERLENLNVSEECFDDILSIVEEYINEVSVNFVSRAARNSLPRRNKQVQMSSKMIDSANDYWEKEKASGVNNNITIPRLRHAQALANGGEGDTRNANTVLKKVEKQYPNSSMNRKLNSKETYVPVADGGNQRITVR